MGVTLSTIDAMPERHLEEYILFYQEQPFGLWRDDYRAALISSTVANTVSKKAFKPTDFMPFYLRHGDSLEGDLDEMLAGAIKV